MTRKIAEFHAVSYALKVKQPNKLKALVADMKPMPFVVSPTDKECGNNWYPRLFGIAFERFFMYYDRISLPENLPTSFRRDMDSFRSKYGAKPEEFMESVRLYNGVFSAVLHGDYNRNNVLFQYDGDASPVNVKDVKMIDFQVGAKEIINFPKSTMPQRTNIALKTAIPRN